VFESILEFELEGSRTKDLESFSGDSFLPNSAETPTSVKLKRPVPFLELLRRE
jgi:hypothetical protein